MEYYISVALIALAALLMPLTCIPMLKIIQLSGYKSRGVFAWWKGTHYDVLVRFASLMVFGFITVIIFVACFAPFEWVRHCGVVFYDVFALAFVITSLRKEKNKIKFTGRLIRLLVCITVFALALGAGVAWATYYSVYCQSVVAALAIFAPFVALAANAIMYPFEKLNNRKYVKRAKNKLKHVSPIVIGITGSFGKTTAKNLLNGMLAKKYTVLATPGSYNTPMGVCKTVNDILADEQIFIAELGARYKGDIKELCDIVYPKYGIITAIGDMHIETMGSRAEVANVKFELGGSLPQDGLLALNGYNADCKELCSRSTACKKVMTGDDGVHYENLVLDGNGTNFDLVIGDEKCAVTTKLLGAHIAELTCVCAAIAIELGISIQDIADAVSSAKPVEHRLQLMESENAAVTVIDDAFNSNPIGAKNALDVLACFDGKKKIIITPGFVELGAIEKPSNIELGRQIAAVCDHAFLIGSRAENIQKGAIECGMAEDAITICASRDEAVSALQSITDSKVVLFENDLPDNII